MRKLVTIRKITDIVPIEGADAIELIKIDGWQLVAKKGEFQKGDLCVYFEIDSFLPILPEFEFLRKSSFKRMGEHEGFRIKTIKLRGQLSQGLALPISQFPAVSAAINFEKLNWINGGCADTFESYLSTVDMSDLLNVQKYEPPIPVELAGQVEGNFPKFIPKTDQERCQNIINEIFEDNINSKYEITIKLDGTSFTAFWVDKEEGVCGRNWELKVNEANATNSLVRLYIDSRLQKVLREYGKNIAVQGELMGPGIQGNRESLKSHKLFIFDIYDIDGGCYFSPNHRHDIMVDLWSLGLDKDMVDHVPIVAYEANLYDTLGIWNITQLLQFAEGKSLNNAIREGLVFKRLNGGFSFKVISNLFLLKEKD